MDLKGKHVCRENEFHEEREFPVGAELLFLSILQAFRASFAQRFASEGAIGNARIFERSARLRLRAR